MNLLTVDVILMALRAFGVFSKRRLAKFNGVTANFERNDKECKWRWNKDVDELQRHLWSLIK